MNSRETMQADRAPESQWHHAKKKKVEKKTGVLQKLARWLSWRAALLLVVYILALSAFLAGAEVSDRPGIADSPLLTKCYYAIGLFVLGGMDLGTPMKGPDWARDLLWFTYFAAPLVTASAVIEAAFRVLQTERWMLRRLRGHIIIAGCGQLGLLYLKRLRVHRPLVPVVLVELDAQNPHIDEAREAYGARVLIGDINSDVILSMLRLSRAERVFFFTDNDFVNLDAASRVLSIAPHLAQRLVVHVSELGFVRSLQHTRIANLCAIFNSHHIAAKHVVEHMLMPYFAKTNGKDIVVLGGFGRFGQTVLDELQRKTPEAIERFIIVDTYASKACAIFVEQVGFLKQHAHQVVNGDIGDVALWRNVMDTLDDRQELVVVLGSSDDANNLRTGIYLRRRVKNAFVLARTFRESSFADEVSQDAGFINFSVEHILAECFPHEWIA